MTVAHNAMNQLSTPVKPPEPPPPLRQPFYLQPGARQFVKFCIVGASSTVISFTLTNVLYHKMQFPLVPSLTIAFIVSVMNGFFWNRRWTFKEARGHSATAQSLKFLAVNLVGWFLNTSIVVLIVAHYSSNGHGVFGDQTEFQRVIWAILAGEGKQKFGFWLLNGALAVATGVVVFWNFFANRLWTFKNSPVSGPLD